MCRVRWCERGGGVRVDDGQRHSLALVSHRPHAERGLSCDTWDRHLGSFLCVVVGSRSWVEKRGLG